VDKIDDQPLNEGVGFWLRRRRRLHTDRRGHRILAGKVPEASWKPHPRTCWTRSIVLPPLPQPRQFQSCFLLLVENRSFPPQTRHGPTLSVALTRLRPAPSDCAVSRMSARFARSIRSPEMLIPLRDKSGAGPCGNRPSSAAATWGCRIACLAASARTSRPSDNSHLVRGRSKLLSNVAPPRRARITSANVQGFGAVHDGRPSSICALGARRGKTPMSVVAYPRKRGRGLARLLALASPLGGALKRDQGSVPEPHHDGSQTGARHPRDAKPPPANVRYAGGCRGL
jgi:hypothetical protein